MTAKETHTFLGILTLMSEMDTAFSCRTTAPVTRFACSVCTFVICPLRLCVITPYPGFSRGAFTARALAGMLHKVSL